MTHALRVRWTLFDLAIKNLKSRFFNGLKLNDVDVKDSASTHNWEFIKSIADFVFGLNWTKFWHILDFVNLITATGRLTKNQYFGITSQHVRGKEAMQNQLYLVNQSYLFHEIQIQQKEVK